MVNILTIFLTNALINLVNFQRLLYLNYNFEWQQSRAPKDIQKESKA